MIRVRRGRTASCLAAQQVVPSLPDRPASVLRQKSICFRLRSGVFFTLKYFANPVGIGAKFVDDVSVFHPLYVKDVDCNRLCEGERVALPCGNVQHDPRQRVSFVMGIFPKKISHGFTSVVAGGTAGQFVLWSVVTVWPRFIWGADTLLGVASANRHPESFKPVQFPRASQAFGEFWVLSIKFLDRIISFKSRPLCPPQWRVAG